MTYHAAAHFFLCQDCVLRIPADGLVPKFGGLLLARHLPLRDHDVVLDLGTGSGFIGILAARRGHRVVATDLVPAWSECARANGLINGVGDRLEVRTGDLFAPVKGESFDLIATNPPQMPTPPGRDWGDAMACADNGGPEGWDMLDRIIREAPEHLTPQGRLVFTLYDFLGVSRAQESVQAVGLTARILAREDQPFPRLARERLEHLRTVDREGALPPGRPATCARLVICGEKD